MHFLLLDRNPSWHLGWLKGIALTSWCHKCAIKPPSARTLHVPGKFSYSALDTVQALYTLQAQHRLGYSQLYILNVACEKCVYSVTMDHIICCSWISKV